MLHLGSNTTTLGNSMCYNCTALKEVYYNTEELATGAASVFPAAIAAKATLYVPAALVEAAKNKLPYSQFGTIEAYDFSNTEVAEIETDNVNAPVEVYNLGGVKVASSTENLPAGLYIVRQGTKTKKVSIQ